MSDIIRRDSDVLAQLEDTKSSIRVWLRDLFESDSDIRHLLESTENVLDAKTSLLEILEGKSDDSILEEVLNELLNELQQYKNSEPGLYLVDSKTGKSVMRLREGSIYQPPDYVGEDGIKRKAKPVLHPGISAPLTILVHEEGKLSEAKEKPGSLKSLTAIVDPDSIIRYAEIKLRELGYEVGSVDGGTVEEIEIGREYYDPLQSKNDQFHRHSAFGAILAKKVVDGMGNTHKCELLSIKSERNSKQRWYLVSVRRPSLN